MPSIAGYVKKAEKQGKRFAQVVLESQAADLESTPEALLAKMRQALTVMEESAKEGEDPSLRSASGLTGGAAAKVMARARAGESLCGEFFGKAVARALAVSECNACMGRIVAAPTAGSCGILPGAVVSMLDEGRCSREAAVMALFTAGAFGMVIAQNASIAGAEGGCQAEVGAASGMAAAALTDLKGGTAEACAEAFAMALANLEGLVCDPVAGLVELPCIKRNVVGAVNAVSAADMALAGVVGHIPADEVIDAMAEVGAAMNSDLRETGIGGLAGTPTGQAIRDIVTMTQAEDPAAEET